MLVVQFGADVGPFFMQGTIEEALEDILRVAWCVLYAPMVGGSLGIGMQTEPNGVQLDAV